jgi:hypothetical protein
MPETVYIGTVLFEYEITVFCGKIEHESTNDASSHLNAKEKSFALVAYNSD